MSVPAIHALLIGIDTYAEGSKIPTLRGCVNDVRALQQRIMTHRPEAHCRLLLDGQATRAQLVHEMQRLQREARSGDLVWIHYSGHGSMTPSARAPSGMEESLVLWESRTPAGADLRDREFGAMLAKVAATGAEVTVTLDCCHAGGQTRTADAPAVRACPPDRRTLTELQAVGALVDADDSESPSLEQITILYACRDDEKAAELLGEVESGRWHGASTWHLLRALDGFTPQMTWRQVHDQISAAVRSRYARQSPQLAGPGDRLIFGGVGGRQIPGVPVIGVTETDGSRQITVGGGLAIGIDAGARLAIHTVDAQPGDAPVARAVVESAEVDSAQAQVMGAPVATIAIGALARIEAYGYDEARLKVTFPEGDDELIDAMRSKPMALVEVTPIIEAEVIVEGSGSAYGLLDGAGNPLLNRTFATDAQGIDDLQRALHQMAIYRNVQRLRNRAVTPALQFALEIGAPVALSRSRSTLIAFVESNPLPRAASGGWAAAAGRDVGITLISRAATKCYVAVIALQPDWSIVAVEPKGSGQTSLAAGKELRIVYKPPAIVTGEKDVLLKIFVTSTPVDFASLLLPTLLQAPISAPTRNSSSLGWLLDAVRRTGTRPVRPALAANADDKWYVHDLTLNVDGEKAP